MSLKSKIRFTQKLSLKVKITLLFVLVFGGTITLFSVIIFNFLTDSLQKEFDNALYNYAIDVTESITLDPFGDIDVTPPTVDKNKVFPFSLGTALIQIRNINGNILSQEGNFGSFVLPYKKDFDLLKNDKKEATYRTISKLDGLPDIEAHTYRLISLPLDESKVPKLVLQVAVPLTFLESQIDSRKIIFEVAIPFIILIATLGGYFLSSRAIAPVNEIIKQANLVGVDQLSKRLTLPVAKDEVRDLVLTLNEMLERIEKAFQSQERFVADASHQLLTPLTVMKSELERAQKQNPNEIYGSSLQEVEHLISIVKQMLLLARIDAGFGALNLHPVYLDEIILDIISRCENLAKLKNIKMKFDIKEEVERTYVMGDEDLLQQLLTNLIENAIKYSPAGQTVEINLEWLKQTQKISIEDSGRGIPADQLESIFSRFSRVEQHTQGYGLGLAIAQKIAKVHDSKLWAENNSRGGATFFFEIKNI